MKKPELIELNDETACVCFELDKDLKIDEKFYLQFMCEDEDSSIEKKINFNFLSECNYRYKCDTYYLENYRYNDKPTIHKEESNGFHYEYKLTKSSNDVNAILI